MNKKESSYPKCHAGLVLIFPVLCCLIQSFTADTRISADKSERAIWHLQISESPQHVDSVMGVYVTVSTAISTGSMPQTQPDICQEVADSDLPQMTKPLH